MLRETTRGNSKKGKEVKPVKRGKTRFPGIGKDAKRLGVNRIHLYLVLSGERISHSLLARYTALKGANA